MYRSEDNCHKKKYPNYYIECASCLLTVLTIVQHKSNLQSLRKFKTLHKALCKQLIVIKIKHETILLCSSNSSNKVRKQLKKVSEN